MERISSNELRATFSAAMSTMYRTEVPAYGTLLEIVAVVNDTFLQANPGVKQDLLRTDSFDRLSDERHGAIRVGTGAELAMIRRIFAVMGMYPVGYYDLSQAGVPVHSTAFRPIDDDALRLTPFRVFTSLLRLELIKDEALREKAAAILAGREIFTPAAIDLTIRSETNGGLDHAEAALFITEVLKTFRWHEEADIPIELYGLLHREHRLLADVVAFRGPHINHLTPRTLDIDHVQRVMPEYEIVPKAVIEGPPARQCPILLRQTSFKALVEPVRFSDTEGGSITGSHTARFGEIEQRGVALTAKGRLLYDSLLNEVQRRVRPASDGSNALEYNAALLEVFLAFPDDWSEMRREGLAYFRYALLESGARAAPPAFDLETLIAEGFIECHPIIYEDFLPISAAGIFQSNLGDDARRIFAASPSQIDFEAQLGCGVLNEFEHYRAIEKASIDECIGVFQSRLLRQA